MSFSRQPIGGVRGYTISQIGLHWIIAALVFAQLIFGESMTEAIEVAEDGEPVALPSLGSVPQHCRDCAAPGCHGNNNQAGHDPNGESPSATGHGHDDLG